jgi:hypothetical protein
MYVLHVVLLIMQPQFNVPVHLMRRYQRAMLDITALLAMMGVFNAKPVP